MEFISGLGITTVAPYIFSTVSDIISSSSQIQK
jgi:hypothetical protein